MDRKIEYLEWKQKRVKSLSKRCIFSICLNTFLAFVIGLLLSLDEPLFVIPGVVFVALMIFLDVRAAKTLYALSQSALVFKAAEDDIQKELEDYITTVDFTYSQQYKRKEGRV